MYFSLAICMMHSIVCSVDRMGSSGHRAPKYSSYQQHMSSPYRWHYQKTSATIKVTKIAPDNRPLVVKPTNVQMTHMSSGRHP